MVKGVQSVVDNSGRTPAVRIAWPHTDSRVLDERTQEPRGYGEQWTITRTPDGADAKSSRA